MNNYIVLDILIISNNAIIVNVSDVKRVIKMKNKKILYSTKWIAYTAMLTALVVATMAIPAVPTPAGRIYWVDGMVLLAAYLMDPVSAFIAGGIGSMLYDAFNSPSMMLPTLLIHGLQGAVVSTLLHAVPPRNLKRLEWVKALICSLAGAVIVVSGYFIYRCIELDIHTAAVSVSRNVIQEAVGITVAMLLCYATTLKYQLAKSNLLPDFKREMLGKNNSGQQPDELKPSDKNNE